MNKEYFKNYYLKNKAYLLNKAKEYSLLNKEKKSEYDKEYRIKNKDKIDNKINKYVKNNRDKILNYKKEYAKNWRQKNPQLNANKAAAYRASKLQACPKWLTQEDHNKIKEIYINCPKGYHVDHIIPLKGKNMSGLHVPSNLQYLPAIENIKKGNRV